MLGALSIATLLASFQEYTHHFFIVHFYKEREPEGRRKEKSLGFSKILRPKRQDSREDTTKALYLVSGGGKICVRPGADT